METAGLKPAAGPSVAASDDVSPYVAGRELGIPPTTIHKWAATGRISSRRVDDRVLVSLGEVRAAALRRGRRLSQRQAAQIASVAQTTVNWWCKKGYLPYHRFGKLIEIDHRSLARFLALREAGIPLAQIATTKWDPALHPISRVEGSLSSFKAWRTPAAKRAARRRMAWTPTRRTRPREKGREIVCQNDRCPHGNPTVWRWDSDLKKRPDAPVLCSQDCQSVWNQHHSPKLKKDKLSTKRKWIGHKGGKTPPKPGARRRGRPAVELTKKQLETLESRAAAGWGRETIARELGVSAAVVRDQLAAVKAQRKSSELLLFSPGSEAP